MISVAEKIAQTIKNMPEGVIFGYDRLSIGREEFASAAKALERLQKKGLVSRVSKGRFYKPKMTIFGKKRPNEAELLKPYLYQNGQRTAYITGTRLYNQLGLTSQIPADIQIAGRARRNLSGISFMKVSSVKSYADVSEDNYQMLGFLDAMKDLKQIPDLDMRSALTIFKTRIKALSSERQRQIITYALLYPPRVRALLGAVLEEIQSELDLTPLKESLNPFTKFNLGFNSSLLKTDSNWNIQ
ncbi:MAG: DUF6088 family protein [Spirosomataceae bacterium]